MYMHIHTHTYIYMCVCVRACLTSCRLGDFDVLVIYFLKSNKLYIVSGSAPPPQKKENFVSAYSFHAS